MKTPVIAGVPWLYRDPEGAFRHWRKKISDVFTHSDQMIDSAQSALAESGLLTSTKTRLSQIIQGHRLHQERLARLLPAELKPESENDLISVDRVPRQQAAMAYHSTLFRDWVWGRNQIQSYADFLISELQGAQRILFPGAGACGLPWEIHNRVKPGQSLAVDINPLLLLPAKKILSGESVALIEFPQIPVNEIFLEHQIPGVQTAPGFEFLFADAQNLSAKDGTFDAIVTSWFIDIVPRDFRETARLMNVLLENEGIWANIGQLGFEKNTLTQVYGPQEIREILIESGFEISFWDTVSLPYLQSPYSAVGRQDQIWVFRARKKKNSKRPPVYEYWPDWLIDFNKTIPLDEAMRSFKVRTGIYQSVLEYIDGQSNLRQVAARVARDFQMSEPDAEQAVHSFLSNYFESIVFREF